MGWPVLELRGCIRDDFEPTVVALCAIRRLVEIWGSGLTMVEWSPTGKFQIPIGLHKVFKGIDISKFEHDRGITMAYLSVARKSIPCKGHSKEILTRESDPLSNGRNMGFLLKF